MVVIVVQRISERSERSYWVLVLPCCHLYGSTRRRAYQSFVLDVRQITQVGWHGNLNCICHPIVARAKFDSDALSAL
jgi:hypothetical protein